MSALDLHDRVIITRSPGLGGQNFTVTIVDREGQPVEFGVNRFADYKSAIAHADEVATNFGLSLPIDNQVIAEMEAAEKARIEREKRETRKPKEKPAMSRQRRAAPAPAAASGAMTKSRKVTSRKTTGGSLMQRLTETDNISAFFEAVQGDSWANIYDDHRDDISTMLREDRDADPEGQRPVTYTQNIHSSLLSLLAMHSAEINLALLALKGLAKEIQSDLKALKSLRRKSFDDLQVEQIDDRRVRLALADGDQEAAFELQFPMMIDRGLWSERAAYDRGDAVTHGGGLWVAQVNAPAGKPGTTDSGWRLAVKPGRDAK